MFIFGMTVEDVKKLDEQGYDPMYFYHKSENLKTALQSIKAGRFSPEDPNLFVDLVDNLLKYDRFKVCADFDRYVSMQNVVEEEYKDVENWSRKCVLNIAASGLFSSDRT